MTDDALIKSAIEAREGAYAPYSHFRVGASAKLNDGRVFSGVNMENASFGLTVCAERNAMATAVCEGMQPGDLAVIAIAAEAAAPTPPCGACRQVLMEFGTAATRVLLHNVADGSELEMSLGELLPGAFLRSSMPGQ